MCFTVYLFCFSNDKYQCRHTDCKTGFFHRNFITIAGKPTGIFGSCLLAI